ncbi:MAG: hypothetical protein HYY95_24565 [Candidatus Rokubacteria bacterium]|nr:hypothetical protein [Candidatus Rokubacteria bacterium]MBI3108703.1 hypothetical protein [Candidatus Rokubacteria bacterium]
MRRATLGAVLATTVLTGLFWFSPASAGNIWLTGHDADFHCAFGAQCNHFGIALDFARQDAPDKTKPLLFLDSGGEVASAAGSAGARARNTVEGAGSPFPFVVVDPSTPAFAALALTTASFSAIVIASDSTCGGCDNNAADIAAINARTADITDFFNAGGGLVYFAGAANRDTYYDSVPIPAAAVAVSPPFSLTADGVALGLLDPADTDCCATHNSFSLPGAGSALKVAELDSLGFAETLFAGDVTIGGGGFEPGCGTATTPPCSVPSPAALLLLGPAIGAFGYWEWRRRK